MSKINLGWKKSLSQGLGFFDEKNIMNGENHELRLDLEF